MKSNTNNSEILLNINTNKINKNFINTNNTSRNKSKPEKKFDKKKEALKRLKNIGIDTRYISYNENTIYINDQRFSKFSKNRQKTFKKHYPEVEIISSNLFQKICIRASKILSKELSPKDTILISKPENNADNLLKIILEPYSRKYGIKIIESETKSSDIDLYFNINSKIPTSTNPNIKLNINEDINIIAKSLTLDEKVEDILSNIFSGNGIGNINTKQNKKIKIIYPFINISNEWIRSFNKKTQENNKNRNNSKKNTKNSENKKDPNYIIAKSFMKSLESIIPQHKENLLKSAIYIENKIKKKRNRSEILMKK